MGSSTSLASTASIETAEVQKLLSAGQKHYWRIRCSVMVTLAVLTLAFGIVCASFSFDVGRRDYYQPCGKWELQVLTGQALFDALDRVMLVVFGLAPLVDDLWFTRFVLLVNAAYFCAFNYPWVAVSSETNMFPCWLRWASEYSFEACSVVYVCGGICITFQQNTDVMQANLWRMIAFVQCVDILRTLAWLCAWYASCRSLWPTWWAVFTRLAVLVVACRPRWRQRVQARMLSWYSTKVSYQEAAAIAGLLGQCGAANAMEQASQRFRCIRLTELTFEDLAESTPNPALFNRSFCSVLQECDAFISHSWRDDAQGKWHALQEWRSRFIEKEGREPAVWIDKCCIDQSDIEVDLRCLPVFLSGCQKLVVLMGDTYLNRLWCVLELFTFVHMKHCDERIVCIPVGGGGGGGRADLDTSLRSFDVRNCQCACRHQTARLLRIFRSAYGDLDSFNTVVKELFAKAEGGTFDLDGRRAISAV